MTHTLYVNSSGKLVTAAGAILPAQNRPELTAGVLYDFDVVPVAGAAAGTYTLSGDIKFDRRALMMQGVTSTIDDGVIQFRGVSTDTAAFWDKPKSAGERLYLRLTLADAGSSISILEDHIYCRPALAGDDTTPAPNPGSVTSLNGQPGAVVIKSAAGEALPAENGVITLPEIEPGTSVNGLTGAVVLVDSSGNPLATNENTIVIPGADCTGDVTAAGNNIFAGANTFNGAVTCNSTLTVQVASGATNSIAINNPAAAGYSRMLFGVPGLSITSGLGGASAGIVALRNSWYVYNLTTSTVLLTVSATGNMAITGALTVAGRTVSGLYPDRNPVAQIPERTDALGVYHRLDASVSEFSLTYPVVNLVEIRALVKSADPAVTGTVIITPYVDGVARTPVTIDVGAAWAAVTIPLAVENGEVRLVRTGGTLANTSWVAAIFRGITAMVTI